MCLKHIHVFQKYDEWSFHGTRMLRVEFRTLVYHKCFVKQCCYGINNGCSIRAHCKYTSKSLEIVWVQFYLPFYKNNKNYDNYRKWFRNVRFRMNRRLRSLLYKMKATVYGKYKKIEIVRQRDVKTIHRYRERGSYSDRPRSGSSKKISQREEKFLIVTSKHNRFKTVRE